MTEGTTKVRIATAGVIIATFLVGAAVGAGGMRLMHPRRHGGPPMLPLAELALTADQDRAAKAIIEKRRPELEAILHESFPKVRAIHEDVEREVRKLLTPEQNQHLDQLEKPDEATKASRVSRPVFLPVFSPGGAGLAVVLSY